MGAQLDIMSEALSFVNVSYMLPLCIGGPPYTAYEDKGTWDGYGNGGGVFRVCVCLCVCVCEGARDVCVCICCCGRLHGFKGMNL